MKKDYHMHPMIMQKPERFSLFVQNAIQNGISEICVTDHMPLSCSDAPDRIPAGRIGGYCRLARELSGSYSDDISIKVGIEVDYHPSVAGEIEQVLAEGDFDFVIGSSHLHVIKQNEYFDGRMTRNQYVRAMLENTILAAQSGYFNAIAHLDLYRWIFSIGDRYPLVDDGYSEAVHARLIDETLCSIQENGLLLEINPHFAVQSGRLEDTYPSLPILERALQKNIPLYYGSDAHIPQHVGCLLDELHGHAVYGPALSAWESGDTY